LIAALHAYLIYAANVGVYAEWHPFLAKIVALLPSRGMGHLQAFTSHHIAEGQANSSAKASNLPSSDSFLEKLLKMHAQNPEKISLADIFTTCITNVGAGSDTTSISLTALLYNLSKHPSIHQKVPYFAFV
jgi:cytochrome P450